METDLRSTYNSCNRSRQWNASASFHVIYIYFLIQCLFCARHCFRHWGYSREQNRKAPALRELKCVCVCGQKHQKLCAVPPSDRIPHEWNWSAWSPSFSHPLKPRTHVFTQLSPLQSIIKKRDRDKLNFPPYPKISNRLR